MATRDCAKALPAASDAATSTRPETASLVLKGNGRFSSWHRRQTGCRRYIASCKALYGPMDDRQGQRRELPVDFTLIGIDVGTTATKATLIDATGRELAHFARPHP